MKNKNYVIEMPRSGETKVDVAILVKIWRNARFSLSQWDNEFRLIERIGKKNHAKMTISNDVANLLIKELYLIKTPSSTFRNAGTWRQTYGER
jgi:hypothetical protein